MDVQCEGENVPWRKRGELHPILKERAPTRNIPLERENDREGEGLARKGNGVS